jgi:hypothetical protein
VGWVERLGRKKSMLAWPSNVSMKRRLPDGSLFLISLIAAEGLEDSYPSN